VSAAHDPRKAATGFRVKVVRQKKNRRADASKGMIVKPEDRGDAVSRLLAKAGGGRSRARL
jgi:hypothetical protein